MPEKEWECFYCEKGAAKSLPGKCSNCGVELKKPLKELTQEEYQEAFAKKFSDLPEYFLAS